MELFWKVAAGVLVAVILILTLSKNSRDLALLMGLCVCVLVFTAAVSYIQPVVQFINRLQSEAGLDGNMVSVLLKAVGIGLVGEIAGLICGDSGNQALGKAVTWFSSAVILYLTLPMLTKLLELMEKILGEI